MGNFSSKIVWGEVQDIEGGGSLEDLNANPLEDLVIPVELDPDAVLPDYPSTGAASMDLFPTQPVELAPGIPKVVDIGLKLELPYLLCAHITGTRSLAERRVTAHAEFLGCDDRESVHVLLTLAPGAEPLELPVHDPIAHLTVLPIARPALQRRVEL